MSIENASYMENYKDENSLPLSDSIDQVSETETVEEHTPRLFSEENETSMEDSLANGNDTQSEKLFDQDTNEEEDFEIPAFLRKQKF